MDVTDDELLLEGQRRTLAQRRRDALFSDVLLFCCAFSGGAFVFAVVALVGGGSDMWTIGLSEDLVLVGLLVAEVFVLWNNGLRQGVRGHSIGKHRAGLAVVDAGTRRVIGPWRGVLRGLAVVVLVDLAVAAIPIGLPTAIRVLTPDSWHLGFVTYLALVLLLATVLLPSRRRLLDLVVNTEVVDTPATTGMHRRLGTGLELLGVAGVLALCVVYIVGITPLIRFPGFL